MTKMKSSTLIVLHNQAGKCADCRHVNRDTVDFREGRLACWMDRAPKRKDQSCDLRNQAPRTAPVPPVSTWRWYFMFQRHDGENGTWGRSRDLRVLAEDADEKLKAALDPPTSSGAL